MNYKFEIPNCLNLGCNAPLTPYTRLMVAGNIPATVKRGFLEGDTIHLWWDKFDAEQTIAIRLGKPVKVTRMWWGGEDEKAIHEEWGSSAGNTVLFHTGEYGFEGTGYFCSKGCGYAYAVAKCRATEAGRI